MFSRALCFTVLFFHLSAISTAAPAGRGFNVARRVTSTALSSSTASSSTTSTLAASSAVASKPAKESVASIADKKKSSNSISESSATGAATTLSTPAASTAPSNNDVTSTASDSSSNTSSGTASSTASTAAPAATSAATNSTDDPQTSLTLDPAVIATGFEDDGQDVPTAGQVASLTSSNNFINFCLTVNQPLTNGQQIKTGSCNPAPMGIIPSTSNMPSSKFIFPKNFGTIPANQSFTIQMGISGMETGFFVNANENYFAAPQFTNAQGQIQGHSHVVIEKITSLDQTTTTDPNVFAFFKGLNSKAVGGVLTADVTAGLDVGVYKLSSINTAANHQPVLVPVAQHGSLDDAIYFTVTDNGAAPPAETTSEGATATDSATETATDTGGATATDVASDSSSATSTSDSSQVTTTGKAATTNNAEATGKASHTGKKGGKKGGKGATSTKTSSTAKASEVVKPPQKTKATSSASATTSVTTRAANEASSTATLSTAAAASASTGTTQTAIFGNCKIPKIELSLGNGGVPLFTFKKRTSSSFTSIAQFVCKVLEKDCQANDVAQKLCAQAKREAAGSKREVEIFNELLRK